ncbi:MAG TPA: AAA family ATPase, partial [Candidatus Polarisedimenticolia bacterium]|nr:AAA family ATPase [Candidatus Polarisedimenticolia bacterium]
MAGYEISEEISRSDFHFLCRGTRGPDRSACLLKVPRRNPPRRVDVDLLRRELGFLKESPAAGVPRAIELVRIESQPCLVLEGHRGKSLATNLESGLADPGFVLDLSIRLCAVLADLHRADIIHGALRPGSVLVDPDSGEVALTDFCVASRGAGEPLPLHLMREALAYISPEQTGRMNRSVDHRSDLYALGALMYEMLLGRPPFQSEDPLELIHAHIARMPVPPAQASQSVPPVLSDLVMKLLSKTAEQRYQSAAGVRHDLEACARDWSGRRTIEPFRLAERDVPDRFLISQKLYGRERDVEQLHRAFERVCSGPSAMVLVGGYAGIGKTSLI